MGPDRMGSRRSTPAPHAPLRPSSSAGGQPERLIELQASAGNAAVNQLLAEGQLMRSVGDPAAATSGLAPPGLGTTRPTLRQGSRGDTVVGLQKVLNHGGAALEVDGHFGPLTASAVRAFQQERGLVADAVVGPRTWEAIDRVEADTPQTVEEETAASADPTLRLGSSGGPVSHAQGLLNLALSGGTVLRSATASSEVPDTAGTIEALAAAASGPAGQPLPDRIAGDLGARFGADLSEVRVHAGDASSRAARTLGAEAFTVGSEIHFGEGRYDPESEHGKRLLAHEVVHTIQQPRAVAGAPVSDPSDAAEVEADHAADVVARGGAPQVRAGRGAGQLSRKLAEDGHFGHLTEAAVKAYQQMIGLAPSGVVDPEVWKKLRTTAGDLTSTADADFAQAKKELLAGAFTNRGAYVSVGPDFVSFTDLRLQKLLVFYATLWGLDPATMGQPMDPKPGKASQGSGHSEGKPIKSHPTWVRVFQNKLIASTPEKGTGAASGKRAQMEDAWHAAQQLLRAFVTAWTAQQLNLPPDQLHGSLQEFYGHLGSGQTNEQATALGSGSGVNWCAQASNQALARSLLRAGLRFDVSLPPTTIKGGAVDPAMRWNMEVAGQANASGNAWIAKGGHRGGRRLSGAAAHTADLLPGDIVELIGPSTPIDGHVATIVSQDGDVLRIVSGNAAGTAPGKGAVRVEETIRKSPPEGYSYDAIIKARNKRDALQKQIDALHVKLREVEIGSAEEKAIHAKLQELGKERQERIDFLAEWDDPKKRPKTGESWIVTVRRTSQLNPSVLAALDDAALRKEHNLVRFETGGAPLAVGGRVPGYTLAKEFPANDL